MHRWHPLGCVYSSSGHFTRSDVLAFLCTRAATPSWDSRWVSCLAYQNIAPMPATCDGPLWHSTQHPASEVMELTCLLHPSFFAKRQ
jgi:hypothetical protein